LEEEVGSFKRKWASSSLSIAGDRRGILFGETEKKTKTAGKNL